MEIDLDLERMKKAHEKLRKSENIRETPILYDAHKQTSSLLGSSKIAQLDLKLENLQVTGSFKIRGIVNMLDSIDNSKELVTMSAGNFGRSFSYLCHKTGRKATVVMPEDVPKDRVTRLESYGATVELRGRTNLQLRVKELEGQGMLLVHPFDDIGLMEGYGSIGFEILQSKNKYDVVVIPCGGGGLLSGISCALRKSGFTGKIYGVEPRGAASMHASFISGEVTNLDKITTFVNGLSPPFCGTKCFPIAKKYVDKIVLVDDDDVKKAMRIYSEDFSLMVESAGAATLAALLASEISAELEGKNVLAVVSGGNVSLEELNSVLQKKD